MKRIPLTQGYCALVDDQDHEALLQYKWHAVRNGGTMYAVRRKGYRHVSMHRQLLQPAPSVVIDHINHDGLDNRRSNLRICSSRENLLNRRPNSNTSSKYRGVSWKKESRAWIASLKHEGVGYNLGSYDTEIEAAAAYNIAAKRLYGAFAYLNAVDPSITPIRRDSCGENNPKAKLSAAAVKEIRSSNLPTKLLASQYGVSVSTINRVRSGRNWKEAVA